MSQTGPARAPASFEKRILLCVAGLSPQIVTETFYALVTRERFVPTEIHIITTAEGAKRIRLTLLENDAKEQHFHKLCGDLDIDPVAVRFDATTIYQVSGNDAPLDDIRSIDDNKAAADTITARVRDLTADLETAIHASIAGGRKTMGFYLGYAMSLFGREQDCLSHVLVSPPFESHPEFYYPPKKPKVLRDRDNRPIHTPDARITLADIPFVRLRGHLDNSILGESMSYSDTVARTQRNVNPPMLTLSHAEQTIYCGDVPVTLPPSQFAFYAWIVRRFLSNNPGVHWTQEGAGEEYLEEYARLVSEYGGDYEKAHKTLKPGMDATFFEPKVSKINKKLKDDLGSEPARPYLLANIGAIPGSRYMLKGLTLKKNQVRFLEEWRKRQACQAGNIGIFCYKGNL